jgi:hypothetical protein
MSARQQAFHVLLHTSISHAASHVLILEVMRHLNA